MDIPMDKEENKSVSEFVILFQYEEVLCVRKVDLLGFVGVTRLRRLKYLDEKEPSLKHRKYLLHTSENVTILKRTLPAMPKRTSQVVIYSLELAMEFIRTMGASCDAFRKRFSNSPPIKLQVEVDAPKNHQSSLSMDVFHPLNETPFDVKHTNTLNVQATNTVQPFQHKHNSEDDMSNIEIDSRDETISDRDEAPRQTEALKSNLTGIGITYEKQYHNKSEFITKRKHTTSTDSTASIQSQSLPRTNMHRKQDNIQSTDKQLCHHNHPCIVYVVCPHMCVPFHQNQTKHSASDETTPIIIKTSTQTAEKKYANTPPIDIPSVLQSLPILKSVMQIPEDECCVARDFSDVADGNGNGNEIRIQ